jgi:hypothetical protein
VFLGSHKILNTNLENDIPKSNILDIKIFMMDKNAMEIVDSEIKLAQQGQIKANQEQMRNDKKISGVKRL